MAQPPSPPQPPAPLTCSSGCAAVACAAPPASRRCRLAAGPSAAICTCASLTAAGSQMRFSSSRASISASFSPPQPRRRSSTDVSWLLIAPQLSRGRRPRPARGVAGTAAGRWGGLGAAQLRPKLSDSRRSCGGAAQAPPTLTAFLYRWCVPRRRQETSWLSLGKMQRRHGGGGSPFRPSALSNALDCAR